MSVVALDMVAALTLLPVLLVTFGHRISARPASSDSTGIFVSLAQFARSRPIILISAPSPRCSLLVAAPFLGARFADPDERSLPTSSQSRQLAELARSDFPAIDGEDPITVVGPSDVRCRGSRSRHRAEQDRRRRRGSTALQQARPDDHRYLAAAAGSGRPAADIVQRRTQAR